MSDTSRIVLSVTGSDRPGLTSLISEAVLAAGGNWQEGHLSRLGGLYVGSVLVEVPQANVTQLEEAIGAIDTDGLSVAIHQAGSERDAVGAALLFELLGQDRPGIIREVSAVLAQLEVNIEGLSSGEHNAAWGGERLFKAKLHVTLPKGMSPEEVQEALEDISSEIMVDFTFETEGGASL